MLNPEQLVTHFGRAEGDVELVRVGGRYWRGGGQGGGDGKRKQSQQQCVAAGAVAQ